MKLTDAQLVVLSAALAREDGSLLPLPKTLRGGAGQKVCSALLAKKLVEEAAIGREQAREHQEKVFRTTPKRGPLMLRITALAAQALNADGSQASTAPLVDQSPQRGGGNKKAAAKPQKSGTSQREANDARAPREGSKLDRLIALLRRPEGVSINEASAALAWREHSVRGAVAGALKKKYGLAIATEKVEGRGTVYQIAG